MNEQLTLEILFNPNHLVTQTLLYIHAMETFIYKDLKRASLEKDITKVRTLGPYAYVMSMIVNSSFFKKTNYDKELAKKYLNKTLFRGILIDKKKFNDQFLENVFNTD